LRTYVGSVVRRVDQLEGCQITRCRGRPIRETIKKDLEINEFDKYMLNGRTLWRCLIHVADTILWDKTWLLFLHLLLTFISIFGLLQLCSKSCFGYN
jgi:hypothetical protein